MHPWTTPSVPELSECLWNDKQVKNNRHPLPALWATVGQCSSPFQRPEHSSVTQTEAKPPTYCRNVTSDEAGTKLYWLVTEAHVCKQLAPGCYLAVYQAGVEPATLRSLVRHTTVRLPSHTSWTVCVTTLCLKKRHTLYCPHLCKLLTNFPNSFISTFSIQLATKRLLSISPHLNCIATLPCER